MGLFGWGCSSEPNRPPYLAPCEGEGCGSSPLGGVVGGSGQPTGGAAGSGGAASEPATIDGTVEVYNDSLFSGMTAYPEPSAVSADGPEGSRVVAISGVAGAFQLRVKKAPLNWFLVQPEDSGAVLAGLFAVNTQQVERPRLGLVRSETVDTVFSASFSQVPRQPNTAHALLSFTNAAGAGVAGVTLEAPENLLVAYAVAGTWSASAGETSQVGKVFVGNLPAGATPTEVTLTAVGTSSKEVKLRVVAEAVTVLPVVLP
jgi:hypothetical protein